MGGGGAGSLIESGGRGVDKCAAETLESGVSGGGGAGRRGGNRSESQNTKSKRGNIHSDWKTVQEEGWRWA